MTTRRWPAIVLAATLLAAACSSGDDEGSPSDQPGGGLQGTLEVVVADADRCDPIAEGCLLP
ncbi:MAG: hypothetical protein ABIP36_00310, partial [Acidimicrobiales bacterium]